MSIYTGAQILARSAILDGKSAAISKALFDEVTAERADVSWVTGVKWIVDGNIWTAANTSVGMGTALAFIEEVYGAELAYAITTYMEYDRETSPTNNSLAGAWNSTSSYV